MTQSHADGADEELLPVRATQDGHHLSLAFGDEPQETSRVLVGLAMFLGLVFLICMFAAGMVEDSSQAIANVIGFGGLGLGVLGLGVGLTASIRAGKFAHRTDGQINVTKNSLDSSLDADPYASIRMSSSATDDYPQFRRTIELGLIDRIVTTPTQLKGRSNRYEVRVFGKNGVEYVIAVDRSDDEAKEIAARLRTHLELPADPAATVAELRDAVSEQTKGPIIVPEQQTAPYERD